MARHRHRSVDPVDLLVTVRHIERHRAEVRVRVGELAGSETHVGGAGILAGGLSRAAEREVRALVQRRAVRGVEAAHAVCQPVIIRGVVMTRHRHCRIDLVDGLVTVRHVERHRCEVRVRVGELTGGETHIRGTGIRPGSRGRAAEREVDVVARHLVQVRVGRGRVARHRVESSIIIRGVVGTGDGHDGVDRLDHQLAVHNHKRHVREVVVDIGEVARNKSHLVAACIRAARRSTAAEREVGSRVEAVAEGHVIIRHRVQPAVIIHRVAVLRDRHRHVNRQNRQVAVGDVEGHFREVRVRVGELTCGETHVGRAGILACRRNHATHQRRAGSGREGEVAVHIVEGVVRRGGIARHRVESTVVIRRVNITDNGDDDTGERSDLERVVLHRYRVVRVRSGCCRHRDDILTHILAGLAAQAVNRSRAVGGNTRHRSRQCRIGGSVVVIDFRLGIRCDDDCGRLDRERVILGYHDIVQVSRGIHRHRNDILADILTMFAAQTVIRSNAVGRDARHRGRQSGISRSVVVIDFRLGIGFDHNRVRRDT